MHSKTLTQVVLTVPVDYNPQNLSESCPQGVRTASSSVIACVKIVRHDPQHLRRTHHLGQIIASHADALWACHVFQRASAWEARQIRDGKDMKVELRELKKLLSMPTIIYNICFCF